MATNKSRKIGAAIGTMLLCSVTLAACGTSKPPQYPGGGNGGAQSTTTSTVPSTSRSGVGVVNSPTWVAAQYVKVAWALDPTWPDLNYAYTLERPYLTRTMNAYDARQAERPALSAVVAKWQSEVRFKVGSYALVSSSWIVQAAGVTVTTCVAQVDFLLGSTTDGIKSPTVGSVLTYAFHMQRIGGTWFVASGPQQPE